MNEIKIFESDIERKISEAKNQWENVQSLGRRTVEESINLGGILKEINDETDNFRRDCEIIGISHQTGYRLIKAFKEQDKFLEGMTVSDVVRTKSVTNGYTEEKDPFEHWSDEEKELKDKWESGETILINIDKHKYLLKFANNQGDYIRIDRGTAWGNPFIMNSDGNRDEVCEWYEKYYYPLKRSLHEKIDNLKGKVLGCHCYPERCHGETIINHCNEEN